MKHDTSLPTQPHPCYSYLLYFYDQFSTLYISYIFQLKFKLSWPLCIFLTHKNTKSHIIKTHNCCESIKRELKQKKQFLRQTSSLANVLYISVFTLQPDGESTESLPVLNVWLIGHIRGRSATRQVQKINPSTSRVLFKGDKMGGKINKQKNPTEKKIIVPCEFLFFLQVGESHLKEKKKLISFFFFSSSLKTEQAVDYTLHQRFAVC